MARQIGLTGPDARDQVRTRLEAIDPSAWGGTGQAAAPAPAPAPPKAAKPAKAPTPPKQPKPKVERQRPSRRLLGLLALLVVLVIIVAAISLSGDDEPEPAAPLPTTTTQPTSTESTTTDKPPSTTTTTTTPPTTPPVAMDPLPGMPDRGTATVSIAGEGDARNIQVELKGMPAPGGGRGVYAVWLYNTLIGAELLGTIDRGDGSISTPLPDNAADFRYLDISRESGPDDSVHSGVSIRRAELAPLLAADPTD